MFSLRIIALMFISSIVFTQEAETLKYFNNLPEEIRNQIIKDESGSDSVQIEDSLGDSDQLIRYEEELVTEEHILVISFLKNLLIQIRQF